MTKRARNEREGSDRLLGATGQDGKGRMIEVDCNGNIEYAIRRLATLLKKDGIFKEIKMRLAHAKPSERKAEKRRRAMVRKIKRRRHTEALKRRWGNAYDK